MNDSSDPVETSSTRTPSSGRSWSERAIASSVATALRLSLAPGTTPRAPMSAMAATVPAAEDRPGARERPATEGGAQRHQHRPQEGRVHDRGAAGGARVGAREPLGGQPGKRGVEDQAGVGGVVVGDEHHGGLGVAIAGLGDHVPGRALGQEPPAEPQRAPAHVVPHREGGGGAHRRRERAAPRRAPAPPRRQRHQRRRGVGHAQRPPVRAVGALLLDPGLAAQLAEPGGDPLRGHALSVRGGRALQRGELADPSFEVCACGGHGAPTLEERGACDHGRGVREPAGGPMTTTTTEPSLTGGCLCGGVRFELTEPVAAAGYCHCTRCQRRTGTASSAQAGIHDRTFRLLQGEELVRAWRHPGRGLREVLLRPLRRSPLQPGPRGLRRRWACASAPKP